MELKFNLTGERRKALISAISEVTGATAVYRGTPGFAFEVGDYVVDRYGTVVCGERADTNDVRRLAAELAMRGFVLDNEPDSATEEIDAIAGETDDCFDIEDLFNGTADCTDTEDLFSDKVDCTDTEELFSVTTYCTNIEDFLDDTQNCCEDLIFGEKDDTPMILPCEPLTNDESDASTVVEPVPVDSNDSVPIGESSGADSLAIEVPLEGFANTSLENLHRLICGKAALIMKAIGAEDLPVERTESSLRFPWFPLSASPDEVNAYTRFVTALCELAKKQTRVIMKDSSVESEKFAFRCFLLRLGFIGPEYASARKILLANLSGDGSFKNGKRKTNDSVAVDCGNQFSEALADMEFVDNVSALIECENTAVYDCGS